MNGMGHQFLPGSRFPINEHAPIGRCHHLNLLAQRLHRNTVAHNHAPWGQLFLKVAVLLAQSLGVDRVLYYDKRLLNGKRFFEEVVRSKFSRANGGLDGAVAGDHDDFWSVLDFADFLQRVQPVHPGQPHVEQHYVELALVQCVQRRLAAFGDGSLVALVFQHAFQRLADAGFIIDNQNVMHAFWQAC